MTKPQPYTFPNQGVILSDLPKTIQKELWQEIENIRDQKVERIPYAEKLVAGVSESYLMPETLNSKSFAYFLSGLINEQGNNFSYLNDLKILNGNLPFRLNQLWVNFQKKGEYVPVHNHSGIFSFVIWCQIPYHLEDELKVFGESLSDNKSSQFVFYYTDILGKICPFQVPISKEWEWKMMFFPSSLNHTVYPFFTSDESRISISGNIFLDVLNLNEGK